VKFKTLAKVTQARYGRNKMPAAKDRCQNKINVAAMAVQRKSTSTKAKPGFSRPKKMHDQSTFRAS
jgi:hypothetical protein